MFHVFLWLVGCWVEWLSLVPCFTINNDTWWIWVTTIINGSSSYMLLMTTDWSVRSGTQSSGSKNIPGWGWPCWKDIPVSILCYLLNEHLCSVVVCQSCSSRETGLISLPLQLTPESAKSLMKSPRLALAGTPIARTHLNLSVSVCISLILSPSLVPSLLSSHL